MARPVAQPCLTSASRDKAARPSPEYNPYTGESLLARVLAAASSRRSAGGRRSGRAHRRACSPSISRTTSTRSRGLSDRRDRPRERRRLRRGRDRHGHAGRALGLDAQDLPAELASKIPVIVYVAPDGARAASAGVWIGEAADVLAMAPQTNIGSSTPISVGGEDIQKDLRRKVVNDAAASLRAPREEPRPQRRSGPTPPCARPRT